MRLIGSVEIDGVSVALVDPVAYQRARELAPQPISVKPRPKQRLRLPVTTNTPRQLLPLQLRILRAFLLAPDGIASNCLADVLEVPASGLPSLFGVLTRQAQSAGTPFFLPRCEKVWRDGRVTGLYKLTPQQLELAQKCFPQVAQEPRPR